MFSYVCQSKRKLAIYFLFYIIVIIYFQLPLVIPILYMLIVTLLVVVPLVMNTRESITWLSVALSTAIPYYLVAVVWTNKPKALNIGQFTAKSSKYIGQFMAKSYKYRSVHGQKL